MFYKCGLLYLHIVMRGTVSPRYDQLHFESLFFLIAEII